MHIIVPLCMMTWSNTLVYTCECLLFCFVLLLYLQSINQSFIFCIILYRQNQRFGNSHKKIYILEVVSTT